MAAVGTSLFGVMLSKFTSESEVGMLNAAFQLLQPIQIMYRSVGHSTFPPLVAAAKTSKLAVANLVHSVLSLLIRLAFPASLVMFVFAGDFLDLVLRGQYRLFAKTLATKLWDEYLDGCQEIHSSRGNRIGTTGREARTAEGTGTVGDSESI